MVLYIVDLAKCMGTKAILTDACVIVGRIRVDMRDGLGSADALRLIERSQFRKLPMQNARVEE